MITRRNFLTGAAALAGGTAALRQLAAADTPGAQAPRANPAATGHAQANGEDVAGQGVMHNEPAAPFKRIHRDRPGV